MMQRVGVSSSISSVPKRTRFANSELGTGLITSVMNPGVYGTARQFAFQPAKNTKQQINLIEEDF